MDERFYWLGFSAMSGVGPVKFALLLKNFGSAKDTWFVSEEELQEVLREKLQSEFKKFKDEFSVEEYLAKLKRAHVEFITLSDKEYPELFRKTNKPPFLFYIRGVV